MGVKGKLVVISSPSGCGKSTVIHELLDRDATCAYSISMTTREPRGGERHGVDYFFVDDATFRQKIDEGTFVEWAEVHGHYYGTSAEQVDALLNQGRTVLLDIDVQGGLAIKQLRPEAVLIFLLPPSMDILETRLRNRKTDSTAVIEARLKKASQEMAVADQYDYQVINDDLEDAIASIRAIIDSVH